MEQAYKDRFKAEFTERLALVGKALGLPDAAITTVATLEMSIRPIALRLAELQQSGEANEKRIAGLKESLKQHLGSIGLEGLTLETDKIEWESVADQSVHALVALHSRAEGVTLDRIDRLRNASVIGRDFIGSVSRRLHPMLRR